MARHWLVELALWQRRMSAKLGDALWEADMEERHGKAPALPEIHPPPAPEPARRSGGRHPTFTPEQALALQLSLHDHRAANPHLTHEQGIEEQDDFLRDVAQELGIRPAHGDTLRDRVRFPLDVAEALLLEKQRR